MTFRREEGQGRETLCTHGEPRSSKMRLKDTGKGGETYEEKEKRCPVYVHIYRQRRIHICIAVGMHVQICVCLCRFCVSGTSFRISFVGINSELSSAASSVLSPHSIFTVFPFFGACVFSSLSVFSASYAFSTSACDLRSLSRRGRLPFPRLLEYQRLKTDAKRL